MYIYVQDIHTVQRYKLLMCSPKSEYVQSTRIWQKDMSSEHTSFCKESFPVVILYVRNCSAYTGSPSKALQVMLSRLTASLNKLLCPFVHA